MEQHKYTNHLIDQTSPYLLQHAHNPVNWYPWGEEALQKAKDENKIILVSVGYSACHWCHVMEHESFEDKEVAELMNTHFVCIKVDREERPDIDQIYMTAVQLMTGSGGWPLNCFALPDGRPFYGGTYFPKTRWMDILEKLAIEYRERPEKVEEYANRLTEGVIQSDVIIKNNEPKEFQIETLDEMVVRWKNSFDKLEGGGNRAPKFPLPNNYAFLMRYAALGHHEYVDEQVKLTLDKMAFGGIYDQIGGGFARYSTDKLWKVPHFEKMLYDNAQLISLYSEAYTRYRKDLYKDVVDQSIDFCLRELYKGDGIFYSALDADSEGEEGKYYVWKEDELKQTLGDDSSLAIAYYNIGQKADWEHGNNILLRNRADAEILDEFDISKEEFDIRINRINKKLLEVREQRITPGLDDKSLTSWNALMLKGLADAYIAFNDERYLEIAKQTALFIVKTQRKKDGGLHHNYKNGTSNINGYLEDYSFSIEALIRMYEATFDESWLDEANELMQYTVAHFYDEESGMFYFTSDLDPSLVARKMELNDNVIPASNSSMANALFLLGTILDNQDYLDRSKVMLNNVKLQMTEYGSGYSNWGILMLKEIYPLYEIAVVGEIAQTKRAQIEQYYIPNKIVLGSTKPSKLALLDGKYVDEETLYYVCVNKACQLPTSDLGAALKQIK
ncbi:thioredoxin domain-containing protein [bacterium SCSIO 12643]|nr:thioredoxin domain-containing protein [bacterium SCSIO 12643]